MFMKYKTAITLIISCVFILIYDYRLVTPIMLRTWYNFFTSNDMYSDVWVGNVDVTQVCKSTNATIFINKTYKYAVFANCDIKRSDIVYDGISNKFQGKIKYSIYYNNGDVDTYINKSSKGWVSGNKSSGDSWSEEMFTFWMPYKDKYDTITIEIEVMEADPHFFDKRSNVYWSIAGAWTP